MFVSAPEYIKRDYEIIFVIMSIGKKYSEVKKLAIVKDAVEFRIIPKETKLCWHKETRKPAP